MFHLLIEVLNLQVLGLLQQPGENASAIYCWPSSPVSLGAGFVEVSCC